jgi:drug/metabolite transporter (DMT)-like permease
MTRANLIGGLAWMGITILCWGPMLPVAKRTLPYLDPFALGTVRYLLGVALFVGLLVALEGRTALRYDGRFGAAAAFGLVGITGFNLLVWVGLIFTRPEHGSIILALQAPIAALMVWTVRGQRPGRFSLACVAAAIGGVMLVVTKGEPLRAAAEILEGGALFGDLLILAGAVAWVVYTLGVASFPGWSPLRFTTLTCIPGLAGLAIAHVIAIAAGFAVVPTLQAIATVGWQIAYFAVCTVVLGVLGYNNATRRLGPLNTTLMLNSIPIVVFGIEAALGRRFAAIELLGAAIVIGALVANNLYLRGQTPRGLSP